MIGVDHEERQGQMPKTSLKHADSVSRTWCHSFGPSTPTPASTPGTPLMMVQ